MNREKILNAVLANQPAKSYLPQALVFEQMEQAVVVAKFVELVCSIGGTVSEIKTLAEIDAYVALNFATDAEKISMLAGVDFYRPFNKQITPHSYANVQFALFEPHFAVAENGAVWLTEERMGHRVLPFICEHSAMLVRRESIVANMQDAYALIGDQDYGFATFIAGPSKTADIEQSLVLGAHGARSLHVFLL